MKTFLTSFLGALLALIFLIAVVAGVVYFKSNQKSGIEDRSWLVVDLYGEILEYPPPSGPLSAIGGGGPETLHRILENLDKARHDERIEGVIMKLAANGAGLAGMQEIRGAMKRLQADGKRVIGWSDSFDKRVYYIAAACDELYAPPSAYISFTGLGITSVHVKRSLEKLGITTQLHQIKDYKSAAELLTRENMSEAAKENDQWILDDIWELILADISADRGLTEEQIVGAMESAVFGTEEAKARGLIDGILYWDELQDQLKEEDDEELRTVSQCRYAEEDREDFGWDGDKKIAVVHAQGSIGGRESRVDPLLGILMGHESVVSDLREAREDEDVIAIVFRVDSGGGDGLTSDLICHEVDRCAEIKPVVCSMLNVAASGGYYVAYKASKIMADPMSITGSIGSINMKFNTNEFWSKLGVTFDHMSKGPNPFFFSSQHDFTEEQWEIFVQDHWRSFNEWLADVAAERGMSFEEAEKLAHGRVWTGRQAVDNGLIDATGGLYEAIALAKELAEIPADESVSLVHYPQEGCFLDMIFGGGGDMSAAVDWAVYRYLREDLAQTWQMLSQKLATEELSLP